MAGTIGIGVATGQALNAAIAAIDVGGSLSATNTNYTILITTDLSLASAIPAINLAAGDTLSIQGDNIDNTNLSAVIDGGDSRGFIVNSGVVSISDLTLTAMSAPGGTGGAVYVAAGASVSTSSVNFNGDSAAAGGAVYVAQGGTFSASGGSIAGGGAGNGIFIQGNGSITLTNETVTGAIAGAGSVVTKGTVTLGASTQYTGGTQVNGTLSLLAPGAAGSGAITFGTPIGDTLVIGASDAPSNLIDGFIPNPGAGPTASDVIDLQGIGLATSYTLSATNQLSVVGPHGTVKLNLDPTQNYASDSFVLQADAGTGTAAGTSVTVVQSDFLVASEADLNAALALIDVGGKFATPNVAYTIMFTAGFTLTTDLDAINLAGGSSVTINGAGFTLDGAGTFRGFFDYAGGLTLSNMTIQNAVATGGAGGSGATPGGGGAGLGGGLFVASGGAATLSDVSFVNDQAIGGAAGAAGGTAIGGGGGLGGAGGAGGGSGTLLRGGGGGGIGLGATGGNASGSTNGGGGIVIGAAPGLSGTGNGPAGGAGGAWGGGGGAAGIVVTHSSGRGGTTHYAPGVAGSGGVGGTFGGGAAGGGVAGFGGGGANSAGGWGGGGSGAIASGFGGGIGVAGGAGGGLGAGGAIFVQQGGSLTITGGSVSNGTALGGTGSTGAGNGQGLGGGLFGQGNDTITLAPVAGDTLSIADSIADGAGSGGSGSVGLAMDGAGTAVLSGTNSFTGGIIVNSGTLSLQSATAAGAGPVVFGYGATAKLVIGFGDKPAGVISDFLPGITIDLQGIGTATAAMLGPNDVLSVTGGTSTVTLALDPAQIFSGESFSVTGDGSGGTLLTAVTVGGDHPPHISGAPATVTGSDTTPLAPLAGMTIADLDSGQTETATLTLSSTANGVLSNLGGGSYNIVTGTYTVSGTAAAVTAALDRLVFAPTEHQVAPGGTVQTQFALTVTDGTMSVAATDTVSVTAANTPPVIVNNSPNDAEGYWGVAMQPFKAVQVVDSDAAASETVTFAIDPSAIGSGGNAVGTLALPSMPGVTLTNTGLDSYTLSAASPALVNAALQALSFTPLEYTPVGTGYTIADIYISVSDGIATAPSTTRVEVLAGLPTVTGAPSQQVVADNATLKPFAKVKIADSSGLLVQSLTILLQDSNGTRTDATGTLSGAGLIKTGVGTYTLAINNVGGDTTAAVTAEVDKLVFTPAVSSSVATTSFVFSVWDGATTSDTTATTVTATPLVPAITGTVAGQTGSDVAPLAPFSQVNISDTPGQTSEVVTITLRNGQGVITDGHGTLSGAGLTKTGTGTYTLAAGTAAAVTAALRAVVFHPAHGIVAAGKTATTSFTIQVSDGSAVASDATTSAIITEAKYIVGPIAGHATLVGTAGSDVIVARFSGNTIVANGNSAYVNAGAGAATVDLGGGNVTVALAGSGNSVVGGNGNDSVSGAFGTSVVALGNGNDTMRTTGEFNTTVVGGGNDVITMTSGIHNPVGSPLPSNTLTLGNGTDRVVLNEDNDQVSLGSGQNSVTITGNANYVLNNPATPTGEDLSTVTVSGHGNEVRLAAGVSQTLTDNATSSANIFVLNGSTGASLALHGSSDMVFINGGSATVSDLGVGLDVTLGPAAVGSSDAGSVILQHLTAGLSAAVIDLAGGVGGYASVGAVLAALTSDGAGGTFLPLGSGGVDFAGVSPSSLQASNFALTPTVFHG